MMCLQKFENLGNSILKDLESFMSTFEVTKLLRKSNFQKQQGVSVTSILTSLIDSVFHNKSLSNLLNSENANFSLKKDIVYRYLNNPSHNWESLLLYLSEKVIRYLEQLNNSDRVTAFILDDTTYYRDRSKSVELLSKCYDHAKRRYFKGFAFLNIGWSDGVSYVPVYGKLVASNSDANLLCKSTQKEDYRTTASRRRYDARQPKTILATEALEELKTHHPSTNHVLYDSWFSSPHFILSLKKIGYQSVCRLKNTPKQKFLFEGKQKTISEIFNKSKNKKNTDSEYLFSTTVKVTHKEIKDVACDAKLVYVKNNKNPSEWICLLSTDIDLSEKEIIQLYGKRWQIETFFKSCKSLLRLTNDFQGQSYDALTAHSTLVLIRYIFLAYKQRLEKDDRSFGALFRATCDGLADISFKKAIKLLTESFVLKFRKYFVLSDSEFNLLFDDYLDSIPLFYKRMLGIKGCET